ncbi:MAG: TonB-dependent receptor [Fermentimonas sp.]|nr:TonB-dependent receptor [Fermentimonas sp.]MDD4723324.1 TonB-dependent receptor [Fermentimonas sp.]NLC86448.1 TonB-dependent receptor [Bacteroidales bacterium]
MNKKQIKATKAFRFKRFARKSYSVFNSLHKSVTIGVLTGCTLVSAHATSVEPVEQMFIQTASDSIPPTELDEVVVTASKVAMPLNLAAKQVTVISRQEIERAPVRSIEDLLNYVAGVDILQRGPHGVQADITLRGGSFDQTAILLNGINLTNPHTGHYSFDIPINISDIERIEIVQGPSSLVYGAGAFSGGVNIITKKDTESNVYAKVEGGMHGLFGADTRGAIAGESYTHSLSTGYKRSDGYIPNSDYDIYNLLWQSRFDINGSNIDFQAGLNDKAYGANTFYTAAYPNQFDDTQGLFFSLKGETNGKLKLTPHIYWSRHYDEFQLIREGTPDKPSWYTDHNYHRSDVFGMNLNMQYASRFGITSFGGEFRNEGILSNVLGNAMEEPIGKYTKSDNRTNISYYAEHNFILNRITLSLGGLINYNTAVTDKFDFYPAINGTFRATNKLSLYASWNKATRMPTFTDLYYTTATHTGNSNLEAELSEAFEVGAKYNHHIVKGAIAVFNMAGKNMIDWVKPSPEALWESTNHTQINKKGVETNISFDFKEWLGDNQPINSFNVGYMYIDQERVEDELISNYTLNHLRHKFTAGLHHDLIKNLTLSWNFRWQERNGSYVKYSDLLPGERVDYAPFSILDVKANYKIRNTDFFVNANNIFNSVHVDLGNIPQPGFWLSGGASVRF